MVAPSFDARRARTLRRARRLLPRGVHEPCGFDIAAPRIGEDLCVQQCARVHEPVVLRRPAVSEDLLVRLVPPSGVARGKQFAASPVVDAPKEDRNAGEARPRQGKPRKSYKEHRLPNDTLRQTMTVWEIARGAAMASGGRAWISL